MITRQIKWLLAVAVLATVGSVHGALLEWNFDGIPSNVGYDNQPSPTVTAEPGFSTSGLSRGDGIGRSGARTMGKAWGGSNFLYTKDQALAADVCFYLDIIIAPEVIVSLTSIQTPWCGSPLQSPESGQWQYSLDAGTTGWNDVGGEYVLPHGSYDVITLDLTGETALSEISGVTVTFRLLLWGGEDGTSGRFSFGTGTTSGPATPWGNSLIINGDVVPEPSAAALLVLSGVALLLRRKKMRH